MNHTRKFHVHVCPETSKLLQSLAFKRGHLWGSLYGQTFQYLDGKTLIFNCFSPLQLGFVERKALKEENWYGISTLLSLEDALVELRDLLVFLGRDRDVMNSCHSKSSRSGSAHHMHPSEARIDV